MEMLGQHRFGDEWTGDEQKIKLPFPLPDYAVGKGDRRYRLEAHRILQSMATYISCPTPIRLPPSLSQYGRRATPPFSAGSLSVETSVAEIEDYSFSPEAWSTAESIRRSEIDAICGDLKRISEVRERLLDAFANGSLRTMLMTKKTNELCALAPIAWSLVKPTNVFDWFEINPADPASIYIGSAKYRWVFVHRTELEKIVAPHPASDQEDSETEIVATKENLTGNPFKEQESDQGIADDTGAPEKTSGKRGYRSAKTKLAQKYIDEAFPCGLPEDIVPQEFLLRIDQVRKEGTPAQQPGRDTLLRAAHLRTR